MDVAERVDWRLPVALSLAESTGQRISALVHLRRGDFDLERLSNGWIHFRAEHKKNGFDHWVPLGKKSAALVKEHLKSVPDGDIALLFPSNRRKFATERKHMPLQDVALAGGWKEVQTLQECYQRPDDATLQDMVLHAPKLYADGLRTGARSYSKS